MEKVDAETLKCRKIGIEDFPSVIKLVLDVFDKHVAPNYSEEGVVEFKKYLNIDDLTERNGKDHFMLGIDISGRLAGLIEVRELSHICLLFVESDRQGKGIGAFLLKSAIEECLRQNRDIETLTVNSSPNAVGAYLKFGFKPLDEEQEKNGIRFTPMQLELKAL